MLEPPANGGTDLALNTGTVSEAQGKPDGGEPYAHR
jgi:hypothetical protein